MNPRAHPWLTGLGAAALVLIALMLIWDWNWFRPLVEARASLALGQKVTIGHFDVELSRTPRAVVDKLVIENPDGFGEEEPLGSVERLSVSIRPWAALGGRIVLPDISVVKPRGNLRSNKNGTRNWQLAIFEGGDEGEPGTEVEIGRLSIDDGRVRFSDPELRADVATTIRTMERADGGEPYLIATAKGTYNAQSIDAKFRGGSLLSLRETARPYPVDLDLSNGETRVLLKGTLTNPLQFAGANLDLTLKGKDLSQLEPLIGIPLVETPPYDLKGRLDYAEKRVRFTDFEGHVGQSDLSGRFEVKPGKERPQITADLRSERVVLADLGGFIGAAPGKDDQADLSAEQQAEHAAEEASPRLLPSDPFSIPDIRAADFNVHYEGKRIEDENTPLDNLVTTLRIENGKVTLDPLDFKVGTGEIASTIVLDARQDPIHTTADVDFRRVDMRRLMESTGLFEGTGTIGGRANLDTHGNSLADMLGEGNGEMKLAMAGGDVSALLVNLAGLDIGNSILSALGLPQRTNVRCLVGDFALKDGVLDTHAFLVDTEEANIVGSGTVNLDKETIDYEIRTDPKKPSIAAIQAPIEIEGRLKDPSIGPDAGELAARAAPAVALGVFLTPLAALIPTIQLGLGEDSDCVSSVRQITQESENLPEATKDER